MKKVKVELLQNEPLYSIQGALQCNDMSRPCRIIEVEPSVNIINGQSAGIVQVVHNRIVGRLDNLEGSTSPPSASPSSSSSRLSPPGTSPQRGQGSPLRKSPPRGGDEREGEHYMMDGENSMVTPT